ncbi:MAG: ATP-binding protein [Steroidobacteraceae bacterium]
MTPGIEVENASVAWWLRQVNLRLRREVCWFWANRAGQVAKGGLPPNVDPAAENLDLGRSDSDKRRFFDTDVTAKYLSDLLRSPPPESVPVPPRGSWEWATRELNLDDAAQFVLALALVARLDAALGAVCSACTNDTSRPYPTLALAQRLWDDPQAIVALADGAHPLFRSGLLAWPVETSPGMEWHQPLDLHAWTSQTLLDPASALPVVLEEADAVEGEVTEDQQVVLWRLAASLPTSMQLVPILGPKDADFTALARRCAHKLSRKVALVRASFEPERLGLLACAALAWLRGLDLVLPAHWTARHSQKGNDTWFAPVLSVPVRWYLPVNEPGAGQFPPTFVSMPPLRLEPISFEGRLALLQQSLRQRSGISASEIAECARRFRFEVCAIERIVAALPQGIDLSGHRLMAACRAEASNEFRHLAQQVSPRFTLRELILPRAQSKQVEEVRQAMDSLTTVHYQWGAARAWNEGGLAVLFSGPPGTGKTMAAEGLAQALELPMYRIDLSQVVNKYIGETEKNLRRIFDAAEISDCVLLFDEADALFGKRTEVKDAHDRFANIEISYLLERMERFKGLAILATNRKKDLDEAFMRRLRFVIEFPLPGVLERESIWRNVFPPRVDTNVLDFRYLSRQFPLSGGHIRSIAFNACLLAAARSGAAAVSMPIVLVAIKRELDKLNRAASEDLFGAYAQMLREEVA